MDIIRIIILIRSHRTCDQNSLCLALHGPGVKGSKISCPAGNEADFCGRVLEVKRAAAAAATVPNTGFMGCINFKTGWRVLNWIS